MIIEHFPFIVFVMEAKHERKVNRLYPGHLYYIRTAQGVSQFQNEYIFKESVLLKNVARGKNGPWGCRQWRHYTCILGTIFRRGTVCEINFRNIFIVNLVSKYRSIEVLKYQIIEVSKYGGIDTGIKVQKYEF